MSRLIMLVLTAFFSTCALAQQQYRWVKGGGSTCVFSLSRDYEKVTSMCTDKNRNVFAIATIGGQNISADTFSLANSHFGGTACSKPSTLFLSYNCSGQMRFAKLFDTYGTMTVLDMQYDNAGSIYMVGWSDPGYTKYYSTDTTVTSGNYAMYLIKYDTSGKFRWIRFLGADNAANQLLVSAAPATVAVDPQGNPHYIANCRTGMQITTSVSATGGTYDVKYSPTGTLLSANKFTLDSNWQLKKVLFSASGNMYANCFYNVFGAYNYGLMKFGPTANMIWSDTTGSVGGGFNGFAYDGANGIFLAGAGRSGQTTNFAGMSASNTYYPIYAYGLLAKVDTNGVGKWMYHYDCSQSLGGLINVNILPNGNLAASGAFAYTLRRGNDSIVAPFNEGQNPYLLITDSLGNTIKLDQLHGIGFYDWPLATTSDNAGSFYIGGQVESDITATGLGTGYTSHGGNTDFFIMKYGYACNCIAPAANYSSGAASGKTVQYTYTGTTLGVDSLVWNFGDGQKQKVTSGFTTPVAHTFAANGKYNVCVTAYSQCGTNSYCKQTPLSVSNVSGLEGVKVYPNPASSMFIIEGASKATYSISNSVGQSVLQGRISSSKEQVNIGSLSSGTYLLQITDENGRRGATMMVKQ